MNGCLHRLGCTQFVRLMIVEKRTLKQCQEKGPQLMVTDGRIVAVDGTEADMTQWSNGTRFVAVTESTVRWLADLEFIINHWAA